MNTNLTRHPLSALLPALTAEETEGLRESIRALGVLDPIMLFGGQVLDGWNRYTLAIECGAEVCPMEDLPAGTDPVDYVRAKTRGRNMSAGQLALLEVSLREWRPSGAGKAAAAATLGVTNADMAHAAGVSERTIRSAKAVQSKAVEAVKQAVAAGTLSVEKGAAIAKLPARKQAKALREPAKVAAAATPERDEAAFESPTELMAGMERDIRDLQAQVAAAQADDLKAEVIKWRQMHQVAERRQAELMERLADRERELQRQANTLKRIGKAVGCEDPTKLAATVEAMARSTKVAA